MHNGEQNRKLNFPDDNTEVYPQEKTKTSKYVGVYYIESLKRWLVQRYSKTERKLSSNGIYNDEKTAAHASDTLARTLIVNGEHSHKLNFPEKYNEVYPEKKNKQLHRSLLLFSIF